jgi:hypothetical protein
VVQSPSMPKGREVKTKKKCCKSGPRCKRCPAAMKKLERRGLATRVSKRHYVVSLDAKKKDWKLARAR